MPKYVNRVKDALGRTSHATKLQSLLAELDAVHEDQIVDWLWKKCADDPRFFLENFTRIPKQGSKPLDWTFNRPQTALYERTHEFVGDRWVKSILDNMGLKARQLGWTTEEEGEIFHDFCFRGYCYYAKVVTFEDTTAMKLKNIVNTMYLSSLAIFKDLGFNPHDFIPFVRIQSDGAPGTAHELECEDTGSVIEFTTQRGVGAGRSLTVNRMYWTEYSKWERVSEATAGMVGSFSQDEDTPYVHTIDFTGQGVGNRAHDEFWDAFAATKARDAKAAGEEYSEEDIEKSTYTAHFFGRDDFDYNPDYLKRQRSKLGYRKFRQEYPRKPEDAFLSADNAIFDPEQIDARAGDAYLCDLITPEEMQRRTLIITCDPAEGIPDGSNTAIKWRDLETGIEARPPMVGKIKHYLAAHKIKEAWDEGYRGLIVVERNNHGHTTLRELNHLELGAFLYRHRTKPNQSLSDCKEGWPTSDATKPLLEAAMDAELAGGWLRIVSENGRKELKQYCLNPNGKTGHPQTKNEDGRRYFDDEAITEMLTCAPEVKKQAAMIHNRLFGDKFPVVVASSMRGGEV